MYKFTDDLYDKVFDDESFDEHLDVNEYIILAEIARKLSNHYTDQWEGPALIEYLERKIVNYSQLYSF